MKPFWVPVVRGLDHLAIDYLSQWMWVGTYRAICGASADDTGGPLTGGRCKNCLRGLNALLGPQRGREIALVPAMADDETLNVVDPFGQEGGW